MSATKTWPRSQSLPPRAHLDHPQPAAEAASKQDGDSKARASVPRAVSIPNLQNGTPGGAPTSTRPMRDENGGDDDDDDENVFTNMAREQIDAATLRELVRFLRTTEPPTRAPSFDVGNDCLGSPSAAFRGDKKRWSIQSLRRGRRSRRPESLQIQLPETAVPKTTVAGTSYIAISVPPEEADDSPVDKGAHRLSSQLRLSMLPRHIRLSNLTMSGLIMPDDLSWVKEVETKRDGSRTPSVKSPPTSPTSPTITVLTPRSMQFAGLSSHPPIPERPETRSTMADRDSPVMMLPPASPVTPVETPRPSSSSSAPPKLLAHRRQLSAFPNTSSSSPTATSPRSRQSKKPSSLIVRSRLEVPQTNQLPESPGFPTMLAAMTFPSPPETSPAHSASNSISSIPPVRSGSLSSTTSHRSAPRAMLESSLDQRMMQQEPPSRPPLRKVRSDAGPQIANVPQRSVVSSLGIYCQKETVELPQKAQLCSEPSQQQSSSNEETKPDEPAQARTSASTTESYQSETASDSYRHSLQSDTTETSISTTKSLRGQTQGPRNRPESISSSMDILNRKRSGRPRTSRPESTTSREQSIEDDKRGRDSKRSSIMSAMSTMSASSSGTVKTSTTQGSLAADRMARKAKIREKFQKDLNAAKAKPPRPAATVFMDSVDSPVLGRFPQNASGAMPASRSARRTSMPGPSPLAAAGSEDDEPSSSSRHVPRRSSTHDIAQLIPRTVPEDASPTTPRAPGQTVEAGPLSPTLTMSPVMIVASIEADANGNSPITPPGTASLRPLSLLNPGGLSPSIPPPRLSIRAEGKPNPRQRPLPIKIAATTKTNRKSVPNMPTPPLSADSPSAMRRMSLPIQKSIPSMPAPTHPWHRPALDAETSTTAAAVSRAKQTEWLRAHQRETAKEWRVAALRERTRLERLAMEKDGAPLVGEILDERDEEEEEEGEDKAEVTRQLRERNSSRSIASSTTKLNNRKDTLDVLNNAAEDNDDDKSLDKPEGIDKAIEERLSRLEKNGDAWLAVVMPLLQDMNQMLRDLRRESVGQDVTIKIMESARAAGLLPAEPPGPLEGGTGSVSKDES